MRTLLLLGVLAAALGCDDDRRRDDPRDTGMVGIDGGPMDAGPAIDTGPPRDGGPVVTPRGLGENCTSAAQCESSICIPVSSDRRVCSESCASPADCPAGWGCDLAAGERDEVCVCAPSPESCNAEDDDCDAVVDEGSGPDVGCALGEVCTGATCSCPPERMCGARCIDIETDPDHCGDCATACAEGDVCASGTCCTPSTETCNGRDDDCDAAIDEGTPAALGCSGFGELCLSGMCSCPPERLCGARCVDTSSDVAHCGRCGNACAAGETCRDGSCCVVGSSSVDVLLMVDNSNSMAEEQASLAEQLPRIARALATGDVDGDGTPEFPRVRDVHLGVVTSDMGTGGARVPTCTEPMFGDDGVLRDRGNTSITGCAAMYPRFLSFDPDSMTMSPDAFARDAACVARMGTGGCGFEQQLEAVLKAVTPSTAPISFFAGTTGHADGINAGFLRPDSILAILLLTDENDCSAADPEIFDPTSPRYTDDLNVRCFIYPGALHPVRRFVDGLLATRSDPRLLFFGQISGVPVDLVAGSVTPDYAAILADPRMVESIDTSSPTRRMTPSCNVPDRGIAFPPRRIVETGRDLEALGVATVAQSICQADYTSAVSAMLTRLGDRLMTECRAP